MRLKLYSLLASLAVLAGCATAPGLSGPGEGAGPSSGVAQPQATPASQADASYMPRSSPSQPLTVSNLPSLPAPPAIPDGPLRPIEAQQASALDVARTQPPADLWERIRRGFAMPDLDTDLVRDREQWYATRPDYIERMTQRSSKYLFHIVEELERRNMPTELALLPFIESAFNPQAVSVAKAAGMWQFIPSTGKHYDLKQNAFRDDRRDVLASTRAALDYLAKLHGMFGDWHLALAAYNWGEGSVGRAIARNQRAGLPTAYTDLRMPNETRYYVPKLQAVKNIVARPQAFAVRLPVIENHPYFQTVSIGRDIDVALAARLSQVSIDDFKALNPSINKPVIMAAGVPQILLPWDNAEIFIRNLASHSGQLASWTAWIVPANMRPADAARRAGMSEDDLRAVNAIPPRVLIRAGSTLLVPRTARMDRDVAEHVADNGQVIFAREPRKVVHKPAASRAVASSAARARPQARTGVATAKRTAAAPKVAAKRTAGPPVKVVKR